MNVSTHELTLCKKMFGTVKFKFGLVSELAIMHREMDNVHVLNICMMYVIYIHTVWRRKSQEHELHDLQC